MRKQPPPPPLLPRKVSEIGYKSKISISDLKNLSALNVTYIWIVVNKFLINKILIELYLAGFLTERYRQMDLLRRTVFFPKLLLWKLRVQPLLFSLLLLSFPSLFLFLLWFSFVTMILELLVLTKHAFWGFFTQMTPNFVRLVFEKSARYTCTWLTFFLSFYSWFRPPRIDGFRFLSQRT